MFENFKPTTNKEKLEMAFLAQAAKLIVDSAGYDVNWEIYFTMFMFDFNKIKYLIMFSDLYNDLNEIVYHVPRLTRSQYWHDSDYLDNVYRALKLAYKIDPQKTLTMIVYILNDIGVHKEDLAKYPAVKAFLENKDLKDFSQTFPKIDLSLIKYLDIPDVPDPFYRDLIDLINKCYSYGIYPAVLVFSRKLLENLLIDILRKKYSMKDIHLFFDPNHCRFRNFNELLKNFKERLDDFKIIVPDLDYEFIEKIGKFKEKGNSSAHRLVEDIYVQKEWLDENCNDLNYIIKVLIRIYNNIGSFS